LGRFKGDFVGGFTVAIVALPLALAFGVASGAGAAAGLYGAIFGGFLASLFGGAAAQVSGPTGAMTVVLVELFRSHGLETLFLAMTLCGLIQILFGVFRLGRYIQFIPHPVIAGFTNGIAVVIFLGQVDTMRAGLVVGLITAAVMFILPRLTKKIPASLAGLAVGTAAMYILGFKVPTIGAIPQGLPPFHLPALTVKSLSAAFVPALTLAPLGSIESLLSAMIVDDLTRTRHDSNRELIGQGIANFVAPLFGGVAGTGAIVRSVVNVKSGGRSRISGMLHALILLLVLLAFGGAASKIPLAALAGILMVTAIGMVDYQSIADLRRMPRTDAVVLVATTVLTVATDLTVAVAVGLLLSALFFMNKMSRPAISRRLVPLTPGLAGEIASAGEGATATCASAGDAAVGGGEAQGPVRDKVLVCSVEGPLFFGAARHFLDGHEPEEGIAAMVLDLSLVPIIDATGCVAIEKLHERLQHDGIPLVITGLRPRPLSVVTRLGLLSRLGQESVPGTWQEAVESGLAFGQSLCYNN
jgi:SulP family sulfate permease